MKPGLNLNRRRPGLCSARVPFIGLETAYFVDEIWAWIFSGTPTSSLRSYRTALYMNIQEQGCHKNHELKKRATDHVGVGYPCALCRCPLVCFECKIYMDIYINQKEWIKSGERERERRRRRLLIIEFDQCGIMDI